MNIKHWFLAVQVTCKTEYDRLVVVGSLKANDSSSTTKTMFKTLKIWSVQCVDLEEQNPQFYSFYQLQHYIIIIILFFGGDAGGKETKLNSGAQPQSFPYPTVPKSFSYSNAIGS